MRRQHESAEPKTSFDAQAWWLLALVCGVLFLDGLDVSMVGVALPSIGSELGLEPSSLQWVVTGYILGYGGLLLLGGRAADLLGRRRVLLGGLAVFLVASFVGGLANDGNTLIAMGYGLMIDDFSHFMTWRGNIAFRNGAGSVSGGPELNQRVVDNFWDDDRQIRDAGCYEDGALFKTENNTRLNGNPEKECRELSQCAQILEQAGLEAPYRGLLAE